MYKRKHQSAFGNILRRRREDLNLTQQEVSAVVGWTSPEMVCILESGKRHPKLDRIPALAAALHLNARYLGIELLRETAPSFLACLGVCE